MCVCVCAFVGIYCSRPRPRLCVLSLNETVCCEIGFLRVTKIFTRKNKSEREKLLNFGVTTHVRLSGGRLALRISEQRLHNLDEHVYKTLLSFPFSLGAGNTRKWTLRSIRLLNARRIFRFAGAKRVSLLF